MLIKFSLKWLGISFDADGNVSIIKKYCSGVRLDQMNKDNE